MNRILLSEYTNWSVSSLDARLKVHFVSDCDPQDDCLFGCDKARGECRGKQATLKGVDTTDIHVYFSSFSTITKTLLFKYIKNFCTKNWKFSDKNSDVFHISAQNIDCGYSLEPPRLPRRF